MTKRISLFHLLAGVSVACFAVEPIPADFDFNSVNVFFTECLNSQLNDNYTPGTYSTQYIIPLENADDYIARIWSEWSSVNSKFMSDGKEQKIRAKFNPFPNNVGGYTIPQSLEPYVEDDDPSKYKGPDAKMLYYIGTKGGTSSRYPLLIQMHGSGPVAGQTGEYESNKAVVSGYDDSDAPCVYIVPRIPNAWNTYYRWYHKSKQWVWEKILRQVMLRQDIDHDRIYFMGISEGAYGSQRLGSFYADYLGGIGPMAGGEPLVNAPCENLYNTYFNLRTGSLDTAYGRAGLTAYADEYLNMLREKHPDGYAHDVTIVEGADHGLQGGYHYRFTPPMLKQHSRVVNPRHVRWENFAMDGRFRTGFHNLKVIQRSETTTGYDLVYGGSLDRTYYEMDIDDDNNIEMTVSVVTIEGTQWYGSTWNNLATRIKKSYRPATLGRFKVYLNSDLVDLSKPVRLTVNGQELFNEKVNPNLADMVNSCAEYYDPSRVFPASIEVDLSSMSASSTGTAGIGNIIAGDIDDGPVEYYNLQGIKVECPTRGLYIRRQGGRSCKVVL